MGRCSFVHLNSSLNSCKLLSLVVGVPSIYFRAVFVDLEFLFIWCNQVGMCVFVCASQKTDA